jgi:hypothetical protein
MKKDEAEQKGKYFIYKPYMPLLLTYLTKYLKVLDG